MRLQRAAVLGRRLDRSWRVGRYQYLHVNAGAETEQGGPSLQQHSRKDSSNNNSGSPARGVSGDSGRRRHHRKKQRGQW